jgi:very-short-patch-repair endonuclease
VTPPGDSVTPSMRSGWDFLLAEQSWTQRSGQASRSGARVAPRPAFSFTCRCSPLRRRGLGVEFQRQVVIGNQFIVDFLAPAFKLVVEADGRACHSRRRAADERRDRKLARLGYRVLRLDAHLVERNLPEAIALIRVALTAA